MKRGLSIALALLSHLAVGGVREVEVKSDPPGSEQQIYTVRFMPTETLLYDPIQFECRLAQRVELPDGKGGSLNKQHILPIPHIHRERSVKMVSGLDAYVSFQIPVSGSVLRDRFGTSVDPQRPVELVSITVRALHDGKVMWTHRLPTNGLFKPVTGLRSQP